MYLIETLNPWDARKIEGLQEFCAEHSESPVS